MPAILLRTLRHEFRLQVPDAAAAADLAFMATAPEIAGTSLVPVDVPVERLHGFYAAALPGGKRAEGGADHILDHLHGLALLDVVASEGNPPLIHGATVLGPWGRAVLVGAKAQGKTTLTLHLCAAGDLVEGDEHLVVGAGAVVARPRTLRVKEGSLPLVPALADAVRAAPFILTWEGERIHAASPAIGGRPWRIARGRLDALVFLEANHGGRSVMRRLPAGEAFARLLPQTLLPPAGKAAAVARLRGLTQACPAALLQVGDLAGARRHLCRLGDLLGYAVGEEAIAGRGGRW